MGLKGTSHSLPQSEQTVFVISRGPKFLGPPKPFLSIVLLMQVFNRAADKPAPLFIPRLHDAGVQAHRMINDQEGIPSHGIE